MKNKIKNLGQFFTPSAIVKKMLKLKRNKGKVLEPSCGDGAFSSQIKKCTAIELDKTICPKNALNIDFFSYEIKHKFSTIIGNPPYVRFQDILQSTKQLLPMSIFDKRSNLNLFFIYKCIQHLTDHGELIFIVPRDFFKSTSAKKLNEYMYKNGTITDLIDLGDQKIFNGATPNCIIFRYEKDNFSRICNKTKIYNVTNGQVFINNKNNTVKFKDLFFVKVGAVSGADKIFTNQKGNQKFVCSYTNKTNKLKTMFYNIESPHLLPYKSELLKRKICSFNESNWYCWGRDYYHSNKLRIYVNQKTRNQNPFFYNSCKAYDGSILAVFPKFKINRKIISQIINDLNNVDWYSLGFVCNNRFIFSQNSLENSLLPSDFKKYLNK